MSQLTKLEELVITAIDVLHPNAYGIAIRDRIARCTHYWPTHGAVYSVLDRLEKIGCVKSKLSDIRPIKGGRRRHLYTTTAKGHKDLLLALTAHNKIQNSRRRK